MKIVVLDGHALNPGDLSWDAFKKFGEIVVHERTAFRGCVLFPYLKGQVIANLPRCQIMRCGS